MYKAIHSTTKATQPNGCEGYDWNQKQSYKVKTRIWRKVVHTVLYYVVLCCSVFLCVVYYVILYYGMLCCVWVGWFCSVPCCYSLFCFGLLWFGLFCFVMCCFFNVMLWSVLFLLFCIVLYYFMFFLLYVVY